MATNEAVTKALQETNKPQSLMDLIQKSAKELSKALPEHLRPERLVRIALTLIRTNPELAKCTPESFLGSLFVSAQMGIEPIAGQAYILPFQNSRKNPDGSWHSVKEATFILGYRGLASLFYRHEKAINLSWGVRHANDTFSYRYGTEPFLSHIPADGERGPVLGYYVCASLAGGGKPFLYWSREQCLEHGRRHSKTVDRKSGAFYDSSPWKTNEEAMCLKTCLVQLGKLLPVSVEIQRAIMADESAREYKSGIEDALDLPTTTTWENKEPAEPEVIPPTKPEVKQEVSKPKEESKPAVKQGSVLVTKVTRKDNGGATRTFAYVGSLKYFTDDIQMGVALKAWMDDKTPVTIITDGEPIDGAFKITEVSPA